MKTYDSLIEGIGDKEFNDDLLIDIKQRAKRVLYNNTIHIIDPRVKDQDDFPEFTVILELLVFNTFKDLDKDYSALTVICFQDQFAFPLSNENVRRLEQIPFQELCNEYSF
nr:hypothetical protein [uncultured Flavobacterium sp.]